MKLLSLFSIVLTCLTFHVSAEYPNWIKKSGSIIKSFDQNIVFRRNNSNTTLSIACGKKVQRMMYMLKKDDCLNVKMNRYMEYEEVDVCSYPGQPLYTNYRNVDIAMPLLTMGCTTIKQNDGNIQCCTLRFVKRIPPSPELITQYFCSGKRIDGVKPVSKNTETLCVNKLKIFADKCNSNNSNDNCKAIVNQVRKSCVFNKC